MAEVSILGGLLCIPLLWDTPSRCPRNRILSHIAKDMAYSWFVAVGIWSFWGPFGAFPGDIMEFEGRKELVNTGKSSRTWSVPTVSLRLAVFNVFQGFLAQKWLFLALNCSF